MVSQINQINQKLSETEVNKNNLHSTLDQTEKDLAGAVQLIQEKDQEVTKLRAQLAQLESDYNEASQYIEDQNTQIRELRQGGAVEIRDHLGNLVQIHVPGQEPKPVPKRKLGQEVVIPDLSIGADTEPAPNAGFGTKFPENPGKGDVFLRVDMLPSKLFKWNDKKWIEIDKDTSDSYAYDVEYIKHLVEKLDRGEYDAELLTVAEQDQIERYRNANT